MTCLHARLLASRTASDRLNIDCNEQALGTMKPRLRLMRDRCFFFFVYREKPSGGTVWRIQQNVEGRVGGRMSPPLSSDPRPWNLTWDGVIAYGSLSGKAGSYPKRDHC